MILPLGHEQTSVRRLPWVTFTIMGLCVLAYLLSMAGVHRAERRANQLLGEAVEYFRDHPYLEFDARLRARVPSAGHEMLDAQIEILRQAGPQAPRDPSELRRQQEEYERLVGAAFNARDSSPLFDWGLVPADITLHGLVTYQFMHGGLLHLLGNLFILYLAAPFVEDVWGRPLFGTFYLVAGVVAGLFFAARYPVFDGPLIGASGAVAGVMGAFLVRFWKARIRFFYWIFIFFAGTFTAPAWLMLPLWFLKELLWARTGDVVAGASGGGGVAYWAHVSGFAFGVVVAVAMSYFRVEERFIHRAIESKITLVDNAGLAQALDAVAEGRWDEGATRLDDELRRDPTNLDAALAKLNLAERFGDPRSATPALLTALDHVARGGDAELVATHWRTLQELDPGFALEPGPAVRLAECLAAGGYQELAADAVERAAGRVDAATPIGIAVRLTRLAASLEAAGGRTLVEVTLAHPEIPPEAAVELGRLRQQASAEPLRSDPPPAVEPVGPTAAAPASVPGPETETVAERTPIEVTPLFGGTGGRHTLQVMDAVPTAFDGATLSITVRDQRRRLDLNDVQALAVGGIKPGDGKPFLVVDLLLDSVLSGRTSLRVVRLNSTRFDPRRLVGGEQPMASFRVLLDRILRISEALPLPDADSAVGNPFRTFPSLAAYEHDVLGTGPA